MESISHDQSSKPQNVPLQHLKQITDSFSDERVLGRGGSGVVYMGVQQNGEKIAVKKLVSSMPCFQKQFENEVYHLMRIKHPNIVQFVGYCYESQYMCLEHNGKYIFAEMAERLLCLEYLPKGSLDRYLSDESSGLDWPMRYKIIEGICYGLHYLHEEIDKPILHLDLKPANILLGDSMMPKITDFGLSRLLDQLQTICTASRDGTLGYMAPEYLHGGTITPKSDIFSLGVIILEVVTGHRDYPDVTRTSSDDFIEFALKKWRNTLEKAPRYTSLERDCQQIKRCIQIGLICVNPERIKRPTTTKIIKMFDGLESMDCHVSNEVRSQAVQIRSNIKELLVINPHELRFCLELNKQNPCLVQLTNRTEDNVAFYFGLTKGTNFYCIEPASGFLRPLSTFNVVVTMEKRHELPSELQCNDEFLVQSIIVSDYRLTSEHITELFFNNMPGSLVHKVRLTVVYVPPAQPTSHPQQFEGSQENVDALIECVAKNLGYCAGKPIAAFTIYKCLVGWESFEKEETSVFDRLIHLTGSAIENEEDNNNLAYWLSNISTLLFLLHISFKGAGVSRKKPPQPFFHRMPMGLRILKVKEDMESSLFVFMQVEAKYPALHFKHQLAGYVDKLYRIIRDNIKKELSSTISLYTQGPRTTKANMLRISRRLYGQSKSNHWEKITESLDSYLRILKDSHVHPILAQKCFTQIFSYINVQLFNSLLLHRECCSLSNGQYVKAGLDEFELWCAKATAEYTASSWDELKHIRQAVRFLVRIQKLRISYDEMVNDICPILSIRQLYKICTQYWDDKYNKSCISPEIISSMRALMMDEPNNPETSSFLLEDNSSIPFSST